MVRSAACGASRTTRPGTCAAIQGRICDSPALAGEGRGGVLSPNRLVERARRARRLPCPCALQGGGSPSVGASLTWTRRGHATRSPCAASCKVSSFKSETRLVKDLRGQLAASSLLIVRAVASSTKRRSLCDRFSFPPTAASTCNPSARVPVGEQIAVEPICTTMVYARKLCVTHVVNDRGVLAEDGAHARAMNQLRDDDRYVL